MRVIETPCKNKLCLSYFSQISKETIIISFSAQRSKEMKFQVSTVVGRMKKYRKKRCYFIKTSSFKVQLGITGEIKTAKEDSKGVRVAIDVKPSLTNNQKASLDRILRRYIFVPFLFLLFVPRTWKTGRVQ